MSDSRSSATKSSAVASLNEALLHGKESTDAINLAFEHATELDGLRAGTVSETRLTGDPVTDVIGIIEKRVSVHDVLRLVGRFEAALGQAWGADCTPNISEKRLKVVWDNADEKRKDLSDAIIALGAKPESAGVMQVLPLPPQPETVTTSTGGETKFVQSAARLTDDDADFLRKIAEFVNDAHHVERELTEAMDRCDKALDAAEQAVKKRAEALARVPSSASFPCDRCDPSFGCFDGSQACFKTPFYAAPEAPKSATGFSREDAAKLVERKARALTDEYCHGDGGPDGYTWTNKEAEWQVILLEELAEEFRNAKRV